MEEVSTNISRRSVALGAPSALALGSMGSLAKLVPLGAAATLGAAHNSASAAGPALRIESFMQFYNSPEYGGKIKKAMQDYIRSNYLKETGAIAPLNLFTDHKFFMKVLSSFSETFKQKIRFGQALNHASARNSSGVAQLFVELWEAEINANITSDLMLELHTKQIAAHYVMHFLKFHLRPAEFATVEKNMARHEAAHYRRYLRKTEEESLVVKQGAFPGQAEYVYSKGSKRKPISRKKLKKHEHWDIGAEVFPNPSGEPQVVYAPSYDPTSYEAHGTNSTTLEPTTSPVTSTAYTLTPSQLTAIANITSDDIDQNGPLQNMTAQECKDSMRELTESLMRMTGQFYESYVVASNLLTAMAQARIASIRYQLGNPDKVIGLDLDKLMLDQWEENALLPEIRALTFQQRERLRGEFWALANVVFASVVYTGYYLKVAIANRLFAKPDGAVMFGQLVAALGAVSAVSLRSLGYLYSATLSSGIPADDRVKVKATIRTWFAKSDITSGLAGLAILLGSSSLVTKIGATTLTLTRLGTGLLGHWDDFYKLSTWSKTINPSYRTILTGRGAAIASGIAAIMGILGLIGLL